MDRLKLTVVFTNPRNINVSEAFIYYIHIRDITGGKEYRYVGKARSMDRIRDYDRNMLRICKGLPKRLRKDGKDREYRTVHFVLYIALREGWDVNAYPLTSCAGMDKADKNAKERAFIDELRCNLNNNRPWCIEHLTDTTIESLGVIPICN